MTAVKTRSSPNHTPLTLSTPLPEANYHPSQCRHIQLHSPAPSSSHTLPPLDPLLKVFTFLRFRFVPNLNTCPMDPFDDILAVASTARAGPGGKFMPKAKSKQLHRKEIFESELATPSKDRKIERVVLSSTSMDPKGASQNESHNAVASTLCTSAEESIRSHHYPQAEPPNMEDGTNTEMVNPQQVSMRRDTASLVDVPPSMFTASEVDADWKFTNLAKSACEVANERKEDCTLSSSLRNHKRSYIVGEKGKEDKTSRQLRKQVTLKPANKSVNEDIEDVDDFDAPYNPNRHELEENDDEFEVDNSSKKQTASTSSKKKSVAKNGKTAQMSNKANEDLVKTAKHTPKKVSHSTQRRKRCVDKALLEIPEDDLDPLTLPIKDIILLAEYREQLAKKEASTSKTSSTNKSGGDFFHEAAANIEEAMLNSEDDRDAADDEAGERITLTTYLFNYHSFMDKAPRGRWSKQDTELFYEAIRQFGTDFSMAQQLFPDRTRHQIKLKYKKEERQHPLQLSDAVNNHAEDHSLFKLVIERLQQASIKVEQEPGKDASYFVIGEEVEDLTPVSNSSESSSGAKEILKMKI